MKVYKYPFDVKDNIEIPMPDGSLILTVQTQNNTPCIWAMVDETKPMGKRRFRVFGTGHSIDIDIVSLSYIGTFQLLGGAFIGHLFEV